jgi:hypothetical protein
LANQDYSKEAQLLLPRQNFGFQRAASRYEAPGGGPAGFRSSARRLRGRSPGASERPVPSPDDWCAIFGHDLQT